MVTGIAGEHSFRDADPERWLKAQDLLDTTFEELKEIDGYRHAPPELNAPLTVIVGERTDHIFGAAARELARDTGGTFVTLTGEGHVAHRTNPALLAATIREGSTTLTA